MRRRMLVLLASLGAAAVAAADVPLVPSVLVRGVLLDPQGKPAGARVLHVAALDGPARANVELRDGEILNPTGTSEESGRFVVVVPVAFFASGRSFTVGVAQLDALPPGAAEVTLAPVRRNGVTASFDYRGRQVTVDLGEVSLP